MTYNDHGSLTALGVSMLVMGTITMVMRAVSRWHYSRLLEIQDILIIPAYLINAGMGISIIVVTSMHVLGYSSAPKMTTLEYVRINKFEYAFFTVYPVAMGFIKLSILFFYRGIFRGEAYRTWFDYVNWTLIGLTSAWTITFSLVAALTCGRDPGALWATTFWTETKCINTYASFISCAVLNTVLDLAILIEPITMVVKLKLSRAKKIQASMIFLLSSFAVVAGLMRVVFFSQLNVGGRQRKIYNLVGLSYDIFTDLEQIVSIGIFWSYLEVGIGFIVACLLCSARLMDLVHFTPLLHKLTSITSGFSTRSKSSMRSVPSKYSDNQGSEKMSNSSRQPSLSDSSKGITVTQSYDCDVQPPSELASSATRN